MIKIYGVGTDIVKISRLTKHLKNKKFLDRLFNKNEINKCKIRKNSTNCYAKRFAAKEAFSKAIGIGISKGIRFNEIVIKNTKSGKPQIELLGKTKKIISKILKKKFSIFLTLSDEKSFAVATVIISV
tara:strand:- start:1265 stop:1648 length:384 start_codon:yes stop_codon:yes gene_type:complete